MTGESEAQKDRLREQINLLYERGQFAEAIPIAIAVLDRARHTGGKTSADIAISLNDLGMLHFALGDYAASEPFLRDALAMRRLLWEQSNLAVAESLNNLGGLLDAMGNYAEAVSLYQESLRINEQLDNQVAVATNLNNLAALYEEIGDLHHARQLLEQVMIKKRAAADAEGQATEGLNHQAMLEVATSLNNLATLEAELDAHEAALHHYHLALDINRQVLDDNHPFIAASLGNLALVYDTMGDDANAERHYVQALAIDRVALHEDHPDYARDLNNLGLLYYQMGDYARAEPLLLQALEIRRNTMAANHPDIAASLSSLAGLYVATHRESKALTLMEEVTAIDNLRIEQVFTFASENQRLMYLRTLRDRSDIFLSLIMRSFPRSRRTVQAALDLVMRRKGIAAEALATQRVAILVGRYPAWRPQLQELFALRAQIARATLAGPEGTDIDAHQRLLDAWGERRDELETELARIPGINVTHTFQNAEWRAVAAALPADAVLVEFVRINLFDFTAMRSGREPPWRPAHYLAFIVSHDGDCTRMVHIGDAAPIDRMIAAYRLTITQQPEDRANRDLSPEPEYVAAPPVTGRALRVAIFDPLLPSLAGTTRLILAPDGDLTRLPFEVLPTDAGDYLADRYRISYVGVGRDILRFHGASPRPLSAPLIVADPDYNLEADLAPQEASVAKASGRQSRDWDRDVRFLRLPGTYEEGIAIANLLNVESLRQKDALEDTVKACQSPRILHLATHGFFLADTPDLASASPPEEGANASPPPRSPGLWGGQRPENPLLRSGLALAGANTWLEGRHPPREAEDGLLTAEDVVGLDLLGTELVVLSACETGLGEVQVGEGVFGLQRAFTLAGARTLIMSLWKVGDRQTRELMVDFYQRILAGEPRADALRGAQLALRERYPHPRVWGAFICQGDPEPLAHNQPR